MGVFLFITMLFANITFCHLYTNFLDSFLSEDNMMDKDEYIVVLIFKAIAWAYIIMLPLIAYKGLAMDIKTFYIFIGNVLLNILFTDSMNHGNIGLLTKQIINIIQIIATFIAIYFF